jgi:hypothetical protein
LLRAVALLGTAVDEQAFHPEWMTNGPIFDAFRGNPRFDALLVQTGFPTAATAE